MVKLYDGGVYLVNGAEIVPESESEKVKALTGKEADKASAKTGTMAYSIIKAHNQSDDMEQLRLKFDSMTSHDITYVGIHGNSHMMMLEKNNLEIADYIIHWISDNGL